MRSLFYWGFWCSLSLLIISLIYFALTQPVEQLFVLFNQQFTSELSKINTFNLFDNSYIRQREVWLELYLEFLINRIHALLPSLIGYVIFVLLLLIDLSYQRSYRHKKFMMHSSFLAKLFAVLSYLLFLLLLELLLLPVVINLKLLAVVLVTFLLTGYISLLSIVKRF